MKKLVYIITIVSALSVFSSCESFLDTKNYTAKDASSFPMVGRDFDQLLAGVYSVLYSSTDTGYGTYFFCAEVAADYRFGGGGYNDQHFLATGHLMMGNRRDQFETFWTQNFRGVARANEVINALATPPSTLEWEDALIKQRMGEAKFLRAFFNFSLIQLMGNIPLMKEGPKSMDEALQSPLQVPAEEIYKVIASDLWNSYNSMPAYKWGSSAHPVSGRATKWAAASLLARVYLFYTGFYQKSTLPTEEGVELTASQVAAALNDVIQNSGHGLLDNFHALWPYTNTLTKPTYPYIAKNNLENVTWVRDGENKEHIFVTKHTPEATWSSGRTGRSNQFALYFGVRNTGTQRDFYKVYPLGRGWGAGSVNPALWDQWKTDEPDDIRRSASIWHYEEETVGGADEYQWGIDRQFEETGLWQKKVMPIRAPGKSSANAGTEANLWQNFTSAPEYYNQRSEDIALVQAVDQIWMRFADVLLMHSELTQNADGMNQVRARVGLPAVAYSPENIQKERLHELAFEGVRWGDIRRWHIAEQVLANKYGVPMKNMGRKTKQTPQSPGGIVKRYRDTNGFYPIPQRELDLAGGLLKQNPGWEDYNTEAWYLEWTGVYED